jgi:hypothetical protein
MNLSLGRKLRDENSYFPSRNVERFLRSELNKPVCSK